MIKHNVRWAPYAGIIRPNDSRHTLAFVAMVVCADNEADRVGQQRVRLGLELLV
jgi:hypothetical protein